MPKLPRKEKQIRQTILFVEDDEILGDLYLDVIRAETPYYPLLTRNGFEALQIAQDLKLDLIVLDYFLPDMNGVQLYDHLRLIQGVEDIPVMFLSVNAPAQELEKRRLASLRKPFELEELFQAIAVPTKTQGRFRDTPATAEV